MCEGITDKSIVQLTLEYSVQEEGQGYRAYLVVTKLFSEEEINFEAWDTAINGALAKVKQSFANSDLQKRVDSAFKVPEPVEDRWL